MPFKHPSLSMEYRADTLVSDNGSCFTSKEFELFYKSSGIVHLKSATYFRVTNGLAERAVQSINTRTEENEKTDLLRETTKGVDG